MKTISTLFCAGMLMSALCAGFVACNNEPKDTEQKDPPEEIGIAPVPVSEIPEEIAVFFKKHLPTHSLSHPGSEFNFSNIDFIDKECECYNTECFIINSMEEFKAVAPSSVELPVIDFEKHTLIIGQHWMSHPGFTLEKQAVDTESEEMTLSLVYKRMVGASPAANTILYFWGLYPKLPKKPVSVDVSILMNN